MKKLVVVFGIAAVLFSCKEQPVQQTSSSIDEGKTKEVLDHHLKTFLANDLEGTLADYVEESILITPDATYSGLAEIRKNFEGAFAALPKDSITFKLNKTVVAQDIGYILWEVKAPKFELSYATDTFIIRDGKIIRQTYAGHVK